MVLIARAVLDWAVVLAPAPPGPVRARVTRFTHQLTDPVLAPLRRVLPPLRLGSVSVDLAFLVLLIALQLARVAVLQVV